MMRQSDANALKQWSAYVDRKVPVVIYPAPAKLADADNQFVAAPAEAPNFWLGGFRTQDGAKSFCNNNGLSFTEHQTKPRKLKVDEQPAA